MTAATVPASTPSHTLRPLLILSPLPTAHLSGSEARSPPATALGWSTDGLAVATGYPEPGE
ncbi:hypothetical protein [Arthrobacter sp. 131MFCol6.1]|uniref:hypothetical protein n=1 Tax=Arthrobacter sp. 131MFCol6.1 TaxID=1157944 RepID=UPI0012DFCBF6|nr:hypothetical protein [Arthrobacter sp. 131MFCol6.1]